jgi:hypothetical protein
MTLNLVCDVSGSMAEGGKPYAMRTAVLTAAQLARLGYMRAEVVLWGWASDMRHFPDWTTGDDFPPDLLSCSGASNGDALLQWLSHELEGNVVLFTDGYFLSAGKSLLNQLRKNLSLNAIRFIKVGADSNPQLRGADVFGQEDVFNAFANWLDSNTP